MSKEAMLLKEVWVPSEASFRFSEQIDPHSGEGKYILQGLILPFGKISRNNVLYNKDSIMQTHKQLVGRPVMYNHKVDDQLFPVGHFIESSLKEDGWHYRADIDPEEKDLIRKLKRQDLRHVSIQVIGGKVIERQDDQGEFYTEAWISDVIEGSIVPAPGFLDTTAAFAESLKGKVMKEKYAIEFNGKVAFKVDGLAGVTKHPDWDFFAARTRIIDLDNDEVVYDSKKGGWQEGFKEKAVDYAAIDAPLNKVKAKLGSQAKRLIDIDNKIWDELGATDRNELEKQWSKYKQMVKAKISPNQNPFIYLILEDENAHALNKAMEELNLWGDPAKFKQMFEALMEEGIDEDVAQFIKENPNPKDSEVHAFATSKGYEVDEVEEAIYKIAGNKIAGNKAEDVSTTTGAGAIAPTQPLENDKKKEATNDQVIDAFFAGLTSQSGSMSAHSYFLLSYKTVIAERKGSVVFLNKKKYSTTTSQQQNKVREKAKELGLSVKEVEPNYWGQNADFKKESSEQAAFGKSAKDFLVKYGMKPSDVLALDPDEAIKMATDKGWQPKITAVEELIGLADKKNITEKDVDPNELAMGIKVEMEHTNNPATAKKIALDHLAEIPDYYTRLKKMEQDAQKKAEHFIKALGEKAVKAMIKDYF